MAEEKKRAEHRLSQQHQEWAVGTWEGSRRHQIRRWAAMPLEHILAAQEEMHDLAGSFGHRTAAKARGLQGSGRVDAIVGPVRSRPLLLI